LKPSAKGPALATSCRLRTQKPSAKPKLVSAAGWRHRQSFRRCQSLITVGAKTSETIRTRRKTEVVRGRGVPRNKAIVSLSCITSIGLVRPNRVGTSWRELFSPQSEVSPANGFLVNRLKTPQKGMVSFFILQIRLCRRAGFNRQSRRPLLLWNICNDPDDLAKATGGISDCFSSCSDIVPTPNLHADRISWPGPVGFPPMLDSRSRTGKAAFRNHRARWKENRPIPRGGGPQSPLKKSELDPARPPTVGNVSMGSFGRSLKKPAWAEGGIYAGHALPRVLARAHSWEVSDVPLDQLREEDSAGRANRHCANTFARRWSGAEARVENVSACRLAFAGASPARKRIARTG